MLKLFKVRGNSLFPIYKDGQIVICLSSKIINPKINDIVVFREKTYGLMIKKIIKEKNDFFYMKGTNESSIDSRNFGLIKRQDILYKVLFRVY